MNILLTCIGRRSYLADYFKNALDGTGVVVGANSDLMTTGMQAVDEAYIVPQVDSPEYVETLLEICRGNKVKLVVSLFDIDLPYLAKARSRFLDEGIQVAISDPWVIDVTNDKWKTARLLQQYNIGTPATFLDLKKAKEAIDKDKIFFPLIVKPRWGMGSLSIFKADNLEELEFFFRYAQRQVEKSYLDILSRDALDSAIIIQEFISGDEYGIDIFNDLEGRHLATAVKRKLAMRSGETDAAEVVDYPLLSELAINLSELLRHRGNMDVDVLVSEDGKPKILDINARFGGGYPFSHIAGANFIEVLINMVSGRSVDLKSASIGVIGLKSILPIRFKS